ncbi:Superfamily II DNA/RNA helicases, SNF2 family [Enterobacter asburiae]|uniref:Superfamily II DNA/RNA helicases, SNF2 family n=1 Tax=Enterobacter asburiae TaxID=61645 RepID=A0A376EV41_ENTAS|nr:Superfamily II DNA/RNA helicases, SNF2 family [Enterobacter asburiae]
MSVMPKARAAALANSNASVFTINYDNLVWLVEELGDSWPFGTVIPDESTRLKSFRLRGGGKRAAALGKVAHKHVRRWMNLTGTPAPNGLVDLWGQAWFVDQGAAPRTHLRRVYLPLVQLDTVSGAELDKAGAVRTLAGRNTARTGRRDYLTGRRRLVRHQRAHP